MVLLFSRSPIDRIIIEYLDHFLGTESCFNQKKKKSRGCKTKKPQVRTGTALAQFHRLSTVTKKGHFSSRVGNEKIPPENTEVPVVQVYL